MRGKDAAVPPVMADRTQAPSWTTQTAILGCCPPNPKQDTDQSRSTSEFISHSQFLVPPNDQDAVSPDNKTQPGKTLAHVAYGRHRGLLTFVPHNIHSLFHSLSHSGPSLHARTAPQMNRNGDFAG